MENFKRFYENTRNAFPHENIKEFISFNIKNGKAIDLGCGTGRDTIFLIKHNWDVISIDNKNTEAFITENLSQSELKKFKFIQSNFENLYLEENNLIVANYSLPFCKKEYFPTLWNKITSSIQKDRLFRWKFFWRKRFLEKHKKRNDLFNKRKSVKFIKRF